MTVKDGVNLLNEQVQKYAKDGMYAAVVMLTGFEKELFSEEDLERLDSLRGEKLNLVHDDLWKPEEITKEDADLIKRGLGIYRQVLWELHGKRIVEQIAKNVYDGGLDTE